MKEQFIFWAQALDNSSPDHIELHGAEIGPENTFFRQEAVSFISSVIKDGKLIFESQGVKLTSNDTSFVIEVLSSQLDNAGRAAPLVCFGDRDVIGSDTEGVAVATDLNEFAIRIGRSLQNKHFELAEKAIFTLKKKYLMKKLIHMAVAVTSFVVLLVVGYTIIARLH